MRKLTGGPAEPNPGESPEVAMEFIFHSTNDKKGHHAVLDKTAVTVEMKQAMKEIMIRGHFPYRTENDITRDALFHRLAWLSEHMEDGLGDYLQRIKAIDDALEQEQQRLDYERQMQQTLSVVNSLIDSPEQQKIIVNTVLEQIRNLPSGYWKERYTKSIKSQFGHLIKGWSAGDRKK
jgi:Spy/CpxP family protein refolding chaperone